MANEAQTRLRKESRLVSLESLLAREGESDARFDETDHWLTPLCVEAAPEDILSAQELRMCLGRAIAALPDV